MKTKTFVLLIFIFSLSIISASCFGNDDAEVKIINQSGHKIRLQYCKNLSDKVDEDDIHNEVKNGNYQILESGKTFDDGVDNESSWHDHCAYTIKVDMLKTDGDEDNSKDWVTVLYAGAADNLTECKNFEDKTPQGFAYNFALDEDFGALWFKNIKYPDSFKLKDYGNDKSDADGYAEYIIKPIPIASSKVSNRIVSI
jgi:hypothetical protein